MAKAVKPKIIRTAAQMGLSFNGSQGALGPEYFVTGHHSAGPKDRSLSHLIQMVRDYDQMHAALYKSDGLGYHFVIGRRGELLLCRPTDQKGTHTALHNSNNIGIMVCGTTGDKPTIRMSRTYRWLLENAHTTALPKAHRTDRNLNHVPVRGHHRWPDNSTACPGTFLRMYESKGRYR